MEDNKGQNLNQQDPAHFKFDENAKKRQLNDYKDDPNEQFLTTDQGVRINDVDNSLRAGSRGPTLMEDFIFRERMTRFDHEAIPERIVHARGAGAHGYFQPYQSWSEYTKAKFLQDPNVKTPVFVRFSTVVGSRGSADTVRDVRGFATKFYTSEGNYDLVGNNIPVFFIQDGIKFPDLVHSIKPEADHEMPQASSAHDTFWDFASLMPEISHMIMWLASDRAIPRSFRMMEGFGVHTFRWINENGKGRFVKFHWKPVLGVHSLVWDEAQKLAGKDPDWLRRDLWDSIESGDYPEYDLCVQIVEESDEHNFDFDLLDPTKIIPEEIIPVQKVGKMVLNRNPDNFFAETEQIAFHPGNLVPGIDVTNDPLLQARLFSYIDTQINRFNSANFTEIPINRPVCPVHNMHGAGFMKQTIHKGKANYFPNSISGGFPKMADEHEGGYIHYQEKVEGKKIRQRSESFKDYFSQATLFWKSMSDIEQKHIVKALRFELGKVSSKMVRERVVNEILDNISHNLAKMVAEGIGVEVPGTTAGKLANEAESIVGNTLQKVPSEKKVDDSPVLSQERVKKPDTIRSRKVAILIEPGFSYEEFNAINSALKDRGAHPFVISNSLGNIRSNGGVEVAVDMAHLTTGSIMFDAVFIPGGKQSVEALKDQGDAILFINEAYKHCKTIGATSEGVELLKHSAVKQVRLANDDTNEEIVEEEGIVTFKSEKSLDSFVTKFFNSISQHRHWGREGKSEVPA